jgi:hypothetical protein
MKNHLPNTLVIVVATISLVPLTGCFCGQFFRGTLNSAQRATGVTAGNATITAVSGDITARIAVSVEDDGFHF